MSFLEHIAVLVEFGRRSPDAATLLDATMAAIVVPVRTYA